MNKKAKILNSMSDPTKLEYTPEEERTIAHIVSLSTTIHSACHISTGYDVISAGRYPYTATVLQEFNGKHVALYDICRGGSRHIALLELLRLVEVDMYSVSLKATRATKNKEEVDKRKMLTLAKATHGKAEGGKKSVQVVQVVPRGEKRKLQNGEGVLDGGRRKGPHPEAKRARTEQSNVVTLDESGDETETEGSGAEEAENAAARGASTSVGEESRKTPKPPRGKLTKGSKSAKGK